jgi:hypothetical protein
MALRITKAGLEAIDVEDQGATTPEATSARPRPAREVETPAPKAVASRKRIAITTQKSARKKHRPREAKPRGPSESGFF